MAAARKLLRLSLTEYGEPKDVVSAASVATGLSRAQVLQLLEGAGRRIREALRLSASQFDFAAGGLRVCDVAGLIRIGPFLELEVAPKFLGADAERWREDFFFAATISKYGRLLPHERLAAGPGARGDLATLVARAMIGMFWDNQRRPLRTYRRERWKDFVIDGDVEPESIVVPDTDGYEQELFKFDRRNNFNATIHAAIAVLQPEVRDPVARRQLARIRELLAPQSTPRPLGSRGVPSRSRRWQPLVDLASEVLRGFGVHFVADRAHAPGYVLDTWRVWEDLLTLALRIGIKEHAVLSQQPAALGMRTLIGAGKSEKIWVVPDVAIGSPAAHLVVDAKYKGRIVGSRLRVAEADLYEAMAFARAKNVSRVLLAYPHVPGDEVPELGELRIFERLKVDELEVIGADVDMRGISQSGGLRRFAVRLCAGVLALSPGASALVPPSPSPG